MAQHKRNQMVAAYEDYLVSKSQLEVVKKNREEERVENKLKLDSCVQECAKKNANVEEECAKKIANVEDECAEKITKVEHKWKTKIAQLEDEWKRSQRKWSRTARKSYTMPILSSRARVRVYVTT